MARRSRACLESRRVGSASPGSTAHRGRVTRLECGAPARGREKLPQSANFATNASSARDASRKSASSLRCACSAWGTSPRRMRTTNSPPCPSRAIPRPAHMRIAMTFGSSDSIRITSASGLSTRAQSMPASMLCRARVARYPKISLLTSAILAFHEAQSSIMAERSSAANFEASIEKRSASLSKPSRLGNDGTPKSHRSTGGPSAAPDASGQSAPRSPGASEATWLGPLQAPRPGAPPSGGQCENRRPDPAPLLARASRAGTRPMRTHTSVRRGPSEPNDSHGASALPVRGGSRRQRADRGRFERTPGWNKRGPTAGDRRRNALQAIHALHPPIL